MGDQLGSHCVHVPQLIAHDAVIRASPDLVLVIGGGLRGGGDEDGEGPAEAKSRARGRGSEGTQVSGLSAAEMHASFDWNRKTADGQGYL
jgi:hypothetical protein